MHPTAEGGGVPPWRVASGTPREDCLSGTLIDPWAAANQNDRLQNQSRLDNMRRKLHIPIS